MTAFEEFGVMPELIKAVEDLDWTLPTAIQAEAIPLILGGGDVLAAAETGSGKTGAFALPILQIVHEQLTASVVGTSTADPSGIRISSEDRDIAVSVDPTGLICQSRSESAWSGARASVGVSKGKYYYEVTVRDEGLCRIGWATKAAKLELGTDNHSFGYGGTGKKSHNKTFADYGQPFTRGDVIRAEIDLDALAVSYAKNGTSLGKAFDIPNNMRNFAFYPALTLKNAELEINFGHSPMKSQLPSYMPIAMATVAHTTLAGAGSAVKGRKPVCLILEPSRELAEQTHEAIASFRKHLPQPQIQQLLVTGGVDIKPQIGHLQGGVDIVTGTLGRVMELIEKENLSLEDIRFFVLDEADQFTEKDNLKSIMFIYERLPKTKKVQMLMLSATLHSVEIKDLAAKITKFPIWIDLKGKEVVPENVLHAVVRADPITDKEWQAMSLKFQYDEMHVKDKIDLQNPNPETLSKGMKLLKPLLLKRLIDAHKIDQALIFVRTKRDADNLEAFLNTAGGNNKMLNPYACGTLHGDLSVGERKRNLAAFKAGETRFLISTDVAARGIDIAGLPFVINYTLPDNTSTFIHRVGRTGRAERLGVALSLVGNYKEKVWFHNCRNPRNCSDTKACSIWYDEPALWTDIEKLLGKKVAPLDKDLQFTEKIDFSKLGQKKTEQQVTSPAHEALVPTINTLTALEVEVQQTYWRMHLKYNKPVK